MSVHITSTDQDAAFHTCSSKNSYLGIVQSAVKMGLLTPTDVIKISLPRPTWVLISQVTPDAVSRTMNSNHHSQGPGCSPLLQTSREIEQGHRS